MLLAKPEPRDANVRDMLEPKRSADIVGLGASVKNMEGAEALRAGKAAKVVMLDFRAGDDVEHNNQGNGLENATMDGRQRRPGLADSACT